MKLKSGLLIIFTSFVFALGVYYVRWKSNSKYPHALVIEENGVVRFNPDLTQKILEKSMNSKLESYPYSILVYVDFGVACPNLLYETPEWIELLYVYEDLSQLYLLTPVHTPEAYISELVEGYDFPKSQIIFIDPEDPQNLLASLGVFKILYQQSEGVVLFQRGYDQTAGVSNFPKRAHEILSLGVP